MLSVCQWSCKMKRCENAHLTRYLFKKYQCTRELYLNLPSSLWPTDCQTTEQALHSADIRKIWFKMCYFSAILRARRLQLCHRVEGEGWHTITSFYRKVQLRTEHFNPWNVLLRINVFQQHSASLSYPTSSTSLKLLKIITVLYSWPLTSSLQQEEVKCFAQEYLSEIVEGVLLFMAAFKFSLSGPEMKML